jgi:hypothetical protein
MAPTGTNLAGYSNTAVKDRARITGGGSYLARAVASARSCWTWAASHRTTRCGRLLTALRHPEREVASASAHRTYYEPARPFLLEKPEAQRPLQHAQDDVLDLADVVGKRLIDTRLKDHDSRRECNCCSGVMSRLPPIPNDSFICHR